MLDERVDDGVDEGCNHFRIICETEYLDFASGSDSSPSCARFGEVVLKRLFCAASGL